MALVIADECIACDACREECPNEAIEENVGINAQKIRDDGYAIK